MSVKVASNRFIFSSIAKSAAFYQQINANVSDFHKLGAWLSSHAENLQAFRQIEKLETVAEVLSNLPLQEYRLKGQYYLAWCKLRSGQDTRSEFELVVEQSESFRDRGLISLAALEIARKDYPMAIKNYQEAIRWAKSPTTIIAAARSLAVYKADHGDHKEALKELLALYTISRYAEPKTYYDYLNSLAVELAEAGQIEAACEASRIVLASPYAFAYSEWHETGQDLALRGYKSRSSVLIIKSFSEPEKIQNVLYLPEPSPAKDTPIKSGRARLFSLEKWKKKMVKSNGEKLDKLSEKDLVLKILHMSSEEGMTWKKLCKIIDYISKVKSEPDE